MGIIGFKRKSLDVGILKNLTLRQQDPEYILGDVTVSFVL